MTVGPTPGHQAKEPRSLHYIVIWACNVISTNLHLWPIIAEARRRGAKVVVIDPMRNRTAQEADWHIPIRPGTDGALALGMINVIVNENLTDNDYIEKYTVGYPELKERAREYPPERVSSITGIPAADIVQLAREYARTQPAAIRFGVGIERMGSGEANAYAPSHACPRWWARGKRRPRRRPGLHAELRLPGKIRGTDAPGLHPARHAPHQPVSPGRGAGPAGIDLAPPIQALFVYNSNPMVVALPTRIESSPALSREKSVYGRERTVHHRHRRICRYRPAATTTQLEQFGLMFSWGHLYLTLNMPAITPSGEAVPNTEMFRRLAARMGFDDACFKRTDEETVLAIIDWAAPAR